MVLHYGTFNGHRLTMKVVAANLDLLAQPSIYNKLFAIGEPIAVSRDGFARLVDAFLVEILVRYGQASVVCA